MRKKSQKWGPKKYSSYTDLEAVYCNCEGANPKQDQFKEKTKINSCFVNWLEK